VLVLDGRAVRALLTPKLARTAVEGAFRALREEATVQPVRTQVTPPGGVTLLKPAAVDGAFGLKVASLFAGNAARGIAVVQGFVALLDDTGVLDAVLDAAAVTEIRTAAASAVATDALARRDASRLGILGSGVQARGHLLALREVRSFDQVLVWSPSGAPGLVSWAAEQGIAITVAPDAEAVVRGSDVVCTATSSASPVLLGEWLAHGTHVNAVGAFRPRERELDGPAVARATVVVDMRESAAAEAGAILLAQQEGLIGPEHVVAELTDVLVGRHPGRTSEDEITLFSSTGLAVQDVAAASATVAAARTAGAGVEVPFP